MQSKTEKWRQVLLDFSCKGEYENPFLDVSIRAVFTGPSGRKIEREAYWDGGSRYRVAFAPTEVGIWDWKIEAEEKTGLNHKKGEILCQEYIGKLDIYRHGFLRVHPSEKYLVYDDGTPFFWLGDTHWEFAHKERWEESNYPKLSSMFRGMAERRVEQGYNVYQTNLRSDAAMGGEKFYWTEDSERDLPNVEFYQKELDRRMYFLADLGLVNALGLAWFMSIDDGTEHEKNLARYIIARYGALPLVWTLAGEAAGYTPEMRQKRIDGWREVAEYIESKDGYGQLQTAHSTNERPFADYYQNEDWLDFTLNQAGHGDYPINVSYYREFRRKHPNKPFMEGEAFYEFCSTLEENGTRLCTADMMRRVAYLSIQCGGCGYTYGAQGIWDCVWEKGEPNAMNSFNRFDITWYEAIDGIGGKQMGYMKTFYEKVRFWELQPYEGYEDEKTGDPFGKKFPLVTISDNAERMVLYYSDTVRKTCEIKGLNRKDYRACWFDPRTGTYSPANERFLPENGGWETPVKPGEGDWLLVVEQV